MAPKQLLLNKASKSQLTFHVGCREMHKDDCFHSGVNTYLTRHLPFRTQQLCCCAHNSVNKNYFILALVLSAGNCSKHTIAHLIGDLNTENVVIKNNLSNYALCWVKQDRLFLCACEC